MVGGAARGEYRRRMNFLSCRDYTAARDGYMQIRVRPIVRSMTDP